jgi:hypothetical protein
VTQIQNIPREAGCLLLIGFAIGSAVLCLFGVAVDALGWFLAAVTS